jgi:hypothetical protein
VRFRTLPTAAERLLFNFIHDDLIPATMILFYAKQLTDSLFSAHKVSGTGFLRAS